MPAPKPPLCLPAHQVMLPVFLGELVSPETLAATLAELDMALQVLEGKFLQDKAFLTGPHISLADLVAITELMHVSAVGGWGEDEAGGSWVAPKSCSHHAPGCGTLWRDLLEFHGLQTRLVLRYMVTHPAPSLPTARGCRLPSLQRPTQAGCVAPARGGSGGGGPLPGGP